MSTVQQIQEKLFKIHGFKVPYMDIVDKCVQNTAFEDVFGIVLGCETTETPPTNYIPTPPPHVPPMDGLKRPPVREPTDDVSTENPPPEQ